MVMPLYDELEIDSNRVDPVRYPRPVISSIDTWDQSTQIDYHYNPAMPGRRAGWNIPSIAVTNESINTVRSSIALRTASPSYATVAGMTDSPFTASTAFKAIPNMKRVLKTDSEVQITFFIDIQFSAINNQANFAIFRDNQQISQVFNATAATANLPQNVSGSYTDTNPTMKKIHVYDLRWQKVGGTEVISLGRRRTFQVSNLRAQ